MAVNTSLTISGSITGLVEGTNALNFSYTNAASPGQKIMLRLTSTLTSIVANMPGAAYPATTGAVLIVPISTASSPTLIKVAGAAAQVAATLSVTMPSLLFTPTTAQVVFLATDTGTADVEVYFL